MSDSESINEELEVQFNPSFWSKKFSQPVVVQHHVKIISEESRKVKESVPFSTIQYGVKDSWTYDVFGTDLPEDSPVFVYIHGGYWQLLSKNDSSYLVKPFYKAGIRVLVPEYDLAPQATLEEILDQIKMLSLFVLKSATTNNSSSVWFGGHSAGAHLAASLLSKEWFSLDASMRSIFRGLVLISGIYDLRPVVHTSNNIALKLTRERAAKSSPLLTDLAWTRNSLDNFNVLLAVGENDSPAFQNQTYSYNKLLEANNMKTECLVVPVVDHFEVVEKLCEDNYLLTIRIIQLIKGQYLGGSLVELNAIKH